MISSCCKAPMTEIFRVYTCQELRDSAKKATKAFEDEERGQRPSDRIKEISMERPDNGGDHNIESIIQYLDELWENNKL